MFYRLSLPANPLKHLFSGRFRIQEWSKISKRISEKPRPRSLKGPFRICFCHWAASQKKKTWKKVVTPRLLRSLGNHLLTSPLGHGFLWVAGHDNRIYKETMILPLTIGLSCHIFLFLVLGCKDFLWRNLVINDSFGYVVPLKKQSKFPGGNPQHHRSKIPSKLVDACWCENCKAQYVKHSHTQKKNKCFTNYCPNRRSNTIQSYHMAWLQYYMIASSLLRMAYDVSILLVVKAITPIWYGWSRRSDNESCKNGW